MHFLVADRNGIEPYVDMVFKNGGIDYGHLNIGVGENIIELFE